MARKAAQVAPPIVNNHFEERLQRHGVAVLNIVSAAMENREVACEIPGPLQQAGFIL